MLHREFTIYRWMRLQDAVKASTSVLEICHENRSDFFFLRISLGAATPVNVPNHFDNEFACSCARLAHSARPFQIDRARCCRFLIVAFLSLLVDKQLFLSGSRRASFERHDTLPQTVLLLNFQQRQCVSPDSFNNSTVTSYHSIVDAPYP